MDRKDGAKCDPGWNDPPLFSYESQTAQSRPSKPRTFLNKRIAFPLHGASPPSSSNCVPVDPTAPLPACSITTLPPPPSVSFNTSKQVPIQKEESRDIDALFNSSEVLNTVTNNLHDVLNTQFEIDGKDKAEIQRRLDILKKLWLDNKLCKDIQMKLLGLSDALKKDETERADNLQKGLMVDHAPSCSPWMSGVRQLIHHKEPYITNQDESQIANQSIGDQL